MQNNMYYTLRLLIQNVSMKKYNSGLTESVATNVEPSRKAPLVHLSCPTITPLINLESMIFLVLVLSMFFYHNTHSYAT